jgi:hypothetical protein
MAGWVDVYAHLITCIGGTNSCTCMGCICTCHELLQCRLPAMGRFPLALRCSLCVHHHIEVHARNCSRAYVQRH